MRGLKKQKLMDENSGANACFDCHLLGNQVGPSLSFFCRAAGKTTMALSINIQGGCPQQKTRSATSPDAYADTGAMEVLILAGSRDKYTYKVGDLYPPQTHTANCGHGVLVKESTSAF